MNQTTRRGYWIPVGLLVCAVVLVGGKLFLQIRQHQNQQLVVREKLDTLRRDRAELFATRNSLPPPKVAPEIVEALDSLILRIDSSEVQGGVSHFRGHAMGPPFLDPTANWPTEKETRDFLAKHHSDYAALLDKLQLARDSQNTIPFRGQRSMFEGNQSLRNVARFCLTFGMVAVRDRQANQAHAAWNAMRSLALLTRHEPYLLTALVERAIQEDSIRLLKAMLEVDLLDDEYCLQVLDDLKPFQQLDQRWLDVIRGERFMSLEWFSAPSQTPAKEKDLPGGSEQELLDWMEYFESIERLDLTNLDQFHEAVESIHRRFENSRANLSVWKQLVGSSPTTTPNLTVFSRTFENNVILHRLAAVACFLRMNQHQQGTFPSQLVDLEHLAPSTFRSLRPLGSPSFGYQRDPRPMLWGNDIRTDSGLSIPMDPSELRRLPPDVEQLWLWKF